VSPDGAPRQLVLLRHAKSEQPPGVEDLERPLAERGVADATVAGAELAGILVPELVLCSPARRTRQTWRLVSLALHPAPPSRIEPAIYGADTGELLDVVRALPDGVRTAMVVGHEPTMSTTSVALAGPGSDAGALERLTQKYPTSGMAVFRLTGGWSGIGSGNAVLEQFLVPRG
jgi:phosphohistidine phosphatase